MNWKDAAAYNASLDEEHVTSMVIDHQTENGLDVDGKYGPETELAIALGRTMVGGEGVPVECAVNLALSQIGKDYRFGAEVSLSDPSPPAFDCSELFEWACGRSKVNPRLRDGTWNQIAQGREWGTLLSVDNGIATRGALVFSFSSDPFQGERPDRAHVAMSIGNECTIEARNPSHGVGSWIFTGRTWTHACLIAGLVY